MSISLAPAAASVRAAITNLFRRIDLAPAVWIIAGISFVVHVVFGNNYGYFRDELYLMAMSQHPGFGYVDVPPLVPWITLIPRFLTGNALWSLHVISALVLCAGIILLTGRWRSCWVAMAGSRGSRRRHRRRPSSCSPAARTTPMTSSTSSGGRWPRRSSSCCCATSGPGAGSRFGRGGGPGTTH